MARLQHEVKKFKAPKLILEPGAEGWLTLERELQAEVTKALANPIRRDIYDELDAGPMQQSALAQRISGKLGKKFSNALLRHHLQQLERASLIGSQINPEVSGKAKIIYRKADVRVQLSPREMPAVLAGEPKTQEEFEAELKRAFKKSSKGKPIKKCKAIEAGAKTSQ